MITCETCGEVLDDGIKFCPKCGTPTKQPMQPDMTPSEANAEQTPDSIENGWNNGAQDSGNTPDNTLPQNNAYDSSSYQQPDAGQSTYQQPTGSYASQPQGYTDPSMGGQNTYYNPNTSGNNGYYPQQPYPTQPPVQTDGKAVAAMILGIISIVFACLYGSGIIFGIVGLILSILSKKAVNTNPLLAQNPKNKSFTTAGLICSIIGLVLSIIMIIVFVLIFVGIFSAATESQNYYDYYDYEDFYAFRFLMSRFF